MIRKLSRMRREERGVTGLETAIILIAFVVVAAVFAYTALSAGLFSTQESSDAVYSGLKETQSTLEQRGSVIAYEHAVTGETTDPVVKVDVTLAVVSGGEAIDLTTRYAATGTWEGSDEGITDNGASAAGPVLITFSSQDVKVTQCCWTKAWIGDNDGDNLLEENEKAVVSVWFHEPTAGVYAAGSDPYLSTDTVTTNETFRLEIKPATGAVLVVERTTPANLDTVNDLH
jgi:flagellin FlaB